MKKFIALSAFVVFLCSFTSCGEQVGNTNDSSESSAVSDTTQPEEITTDIPGTTTESIQEIPETTAKTTVSTTLRTTQSTTETTVTTTTTASKEITTESPENERLLDKATDLYKLACETEWSFTVGSPFELDTSQTTKNQFGWESYLITDEGIYTFDDVKAKYHEVFSENYHDSLDEIFTEVDGRVYSLNGARGADIFYTGSSVVSVDSKTSRKISFTVECYYSGDDFGNEPYTAEDKFVVSINDEGEWRVEEFRLPY